MQLALRHWLQTGDLADIGDDTREHLSLLFEHDLIAKPVPTFADHARRS
jgi:hypothetical protein